MPLSPNLRGSLFMVIAMASFTINDAISKMIIETLGLGQLLLIRGMFASILVLGLAWSRGALAQPRHLLHPVVALRALCEIGATVTFIAALAHMPLANISAVLQMLPLAVTMGAALFFGEEVGWRRWLAIGVGVSGVMIIVRPGFDGFSIFSLLALVTVLFSTARDLVTRLIPPDIPSMQVSSVTAIAITIVGGIIAASGSWVPVSTGELGLLACAALLLIIGYQFIIMATRQGDISMVAPFRYTALVWAMVLGYVMFGDVPDAAMMIGASAIVLSGLYAFHREHRLGRGRPATESTGPGMGPDGL